MSTKIITQVKEHLLLYFSIIAISLSIYLAVSNRALSHQILLLQEDRDVTQTQIATLFLSMEDREKMALLDRELLKFPAVRTKLEKEVPNLSKKVLDLHYRYEAEGLKGNIILGVMEVESQFTPDAIGYAKTGQPLSYGLMQLIPSTARTFLGARGLSWSKEIMFNPLLNMELGTEYLHVIHSSYMERGLEKKDDFNLTLATYNAGERAVLEYYFAHKKLPDFSRDYVAKVNMARKKWIMHGF
jgi:soluble lytic murein transglycosylase-like protein